MKITASLVLFHNDPVLYGNAIRSYLNSCNGLLYVVDNSSIPLQHDLLSHPRVHYFFAGRNLGFGAGHNQALSQLPGDSELHLLLNPDISFNPEVLQRLRDIMLTNDDIGAVMPKIIYPSGERQNLCKMLPTPINLIFRRFILFNPIRKRINRRYELHDLPDNACSDVPSLSGCFLLVRTQLLRKIGGFDERFFMYMEDVDLVRRLGSVSRTIYCPFVSVIHEYAKGSYRNQKLLVYHVKSAVAYFNKWGWFFDLTRTNRNKEVVDLVRKSDN